MPSELNRGPIPNHLLRYKWYAPHQAHLRDLGMPHHDPGDAEPHWADLARASLARADLARAILARAILVDADLARASLARADLAGAYLAHASLIGADLADVRGLPDLYRPGLAARVLEQIEQHPETWDQRVWHSPCGVRHCAAGWACVLAEVPKDVERRLSTPHAALLALGVPLGEADVPFGGRDDPLPWLRELARKEAPDAE